MPRGRLNVLPGLLGVVVGCALMMPGEATAGVSGSSAVGEAAGRSGSAKGPGKVGWSAVATPMPSVVPSSDGRMWIWGDAPFVTFETYHHWWRATHEWWLRNLDTTKAVSDEFRQLDHNGDGRVSRAEYCRPITPAQARSGR